MLLLIHNIHKKSNTAPKKKQFSTKKGSSVPKSNRWGNGYVLVMVNRCSSQKKGGTRLMRPRLNPPPLLAPMTLWLLSFSQSVISSVEQLQV